MKERIVVMGGSFNPPTLAHYQLMKNAIQAVRATKGIFVPVSRAYLNRKMRKAEFSLCFSETLRVEMLRAMCAGDLMLDVCDYDIRHPLSNTPETMSALQTIYPEAELFFLAGADKKSMLRSITKKYAFPEHFGIAIVGRGGVNPIELIRQDDCLSCYQNSFVAVEQPIGVEEVSSTVIRKLFLTGDVNAAKQFLHKSVWEIFKKLNPKDYPLQIEQFKGEYEFLSGGFFAPMKYEGLIYPNAEAAFQAMRCQKITDRHRFLRCNSGGAKSIAIKVQPRDDWEEIKLSVMESILREKFRQHPHLLQALIATDNALLINGNNGKDLFWGVDLYSSSGENQLGKLLMSIRQEYKEKR